jgi:DNA (cytosine-5)-methyltransferase 1
MLESIQLNEDGMAALASRSIKSPTSTGKNPKTFCEFFAGIGLVREGLKSSDWSCVFANDIDTKKLSIYEAHFGRSDHFHLQDIAKTKWIAKRIPGEPFLATASFPCTDLSLAGNRHGLKGKHSSTFFDFIKVLKALGDRRPRLVMLENVTGFISSNDGRDFADAAKELARLGYWIDAFVLNAKHFVPQSRPRLFIIGVGEDLDVPGAVKQSSRGSMNFQWSGKSGSVGQLRPGRLVKLMGSIDLPTGWTALQLPVLPEPRRDLEKFIEVGEEQEWWDQAEVDRHYRMMSDRHRNRVDNLRRAGQRTVGTIYRRIRDGSQRAEVRLDGLAGCLRTPRGGSAKQIVIVIEPERIRMRWMSPREYARLQGVKAHPTDHSAIDLLYGFGDAVCVPVIKWIDEQVLTPAFKSANAV